MEFEWDNKKHQSNIKKHDVEFEEARSVFNDVFAIIIDDRFHSNQEQREIIVGESSKVAYCMLFLWKKKILLELSAPEN